MPLKNPLHVPCQGRGPKPWRLPSPSSSISVPGPLTSSCSSRGGLSNSTALCPACQHTRRGVAFYPRSFAREGGNAEAGAGRPAVGCEAPVAMPSAAPASAPAPVCPEVPLPTLRGLISSSFTPFPSSPPLCRAAHRGSNPCLGEGSVQCVQCFSEGVHGAGTPQRGYHSPQPAGPAAAPPCAMQTPHGPAGPTTRPRPVGSVPQPTWWLLVASHTPHSGSPPCHGAILPPKAKCLQSAG